MSEKLQIDRPIYPLIGLIGSVFIIVFGLLTAKNTDCIWFLSGMWILFLLYGYWRACLSVLPIAAVLCAVMSGITYAVSHDAAAAFAVVNRILAVCVAVIPSLGLSPVILVRNFSALKIPRTVTLGMMITLTFFPLLGGEVRQVREAMRTRGAVGLFDPRILYRAFLIPLIMRLVNISDTLSLSVETRGFTESGGNYTVYKNVTVRTADILFLLIAVAFAVTAVII